MEEGAKQDPGFSLHKMPFKDHELADQAARSFCLQSMRAYNNGSQNTKDYCFALVNSGRGSGKTTMCREMKNMISNVAELPSTIATIYMDWSGADDLLNWMEKESRQNPETCADFCLGLTVAARGLRNCTGRQLYQHFGQKNCLKEAKTDLTFGAVMYALGDKHGGTKEKPIGVLLTIDGFSRCARFHTEVAKEVVALIGNFMVEQQHDAGVVLFPALAGGGVLAIQTLFADSPYTSQNIPLSFLSLKSACEIFAACFPTEKHLLQDKRMIRLLALCGKVPEELYNLLQAPMDFKDDTTIDAKIDLLLGACQVHLPYYLKIDNYADAVLVGLYATPEISTAFRDVADHQSLYLVNDRYFLPYSCLVKGKSVKTDLLPVPGLEYTWNDFIKLEHALQEVRLRLWMKFKTQTETDLRTLYYPAYSSTKMTAKIRIKYTYAMNCQTLLTNSDDKLDLSRIVFDFDDEELFVPDTAELSRFSFFPAKGDALFDIMEFYQSITDSNCLLVLFKRMSHFEGVEDSDTISADIIEEWLRAIRASTANLESFFKPYFMLMTHKTIPAAKTLVLQNEDLLIVDSTNIKEYLGPSVATFIDVIRLDETKSENSENLFGSI